MRGHTDSMGTEECNAALANRRSPHRMHYVLTTGVSIERITTIGPGETKPIQPDQTSEGKDYPEGRAQNRRAEIQEVPAP